jgi:hypothetical protein
MFFDGGFDFFLILHVQPGASDHDADVRTENFSVFDRSACFDAVSLGLIAGGQAAGGIGVDGDDADGAAAKLRMVLLLDGSEVGIEIKKKPP